jgi:hypothetical protein
MAIGLPLVSRSRVDDTAQSLGASMRTVICMLLIAAFPIVGKSGIASADEFEALWQMANSAELAATSHSSEQTRER